MSTKHRIEIIETAIDHFGDTLRSCIVDGYPIPMLPGSLYQPHYAKSGVDTVKLATDIHTALAEQHPDAASHIDPNGFDLPINGDEATMAITYNAVIDPAASLEVAGETVEAELSINAEFQLPETLNYLICATDLAMMIAEANQHLTGTISTDLMIGYIIGTIERSNRFALVTLSLEEPDLFHIVASDRIGKVEHVTITIPITQPPTTDPGSHEGE